MTAADLVRWVLLVQGGVLGTGLLLLIGHGVTLAVVDRLGRGARAAARRALVRGVNDGELSRGDVGALRRMPRAVLADLLAELAPALSGDGRRTVVALARRFGVTSRAEGRLRSRRWRRRLRGARLLTVLGDGAAVMPALFDDPHPDLRAQAAEWAAGHPSRDVTARLLAVLGDPAARHRFTVVDSLLRIGAPAVDPLVAHLAVRGGADAQRGLEVAAGLRDPRLLPAALRLCHDSTAGTRVRAARLAAALGGEKAVAVLATLLRDTDAEVRATAAEGLGRLGQAAQARALTELLRDEAWDVRRQAALSLRSFGAAGTLLLRRALEDDDPFARDMARQVLDIPVPTERGRPAGAQVAAA